MKIRASVPSSFTYIKKISSRIESRRTPQFPIQALVQPHLKREGTFYLRDERHFYINFENERFVDYGSFFDEIKLILPWRLKKKKLRKMKSMLMILGLAFKVQVKFFLSSSYFWGDICRLTLLICFVQANTCYYITWQIACKIN